ncbi:endonuclease/exonuclease/phosphatase family protein [Demetria terragena]|uniref:endonuclease/exonuclease/phosphatase family protein n=1 Tax=Demetria terragena TaxID=63959 RepID=UPI000368DD90|nr:endonuclease/exonuclease/phosphatase family protein [Demetria terragena]
MDEKDELRRARAPVEIGLGLLTLALGVLLSMRWWDLPRWPVPVVQAAFPILGTAALLWLLIMLLTRQWRIAGIAVLIVLMPMGTTVAALGSDTVAARQGDEVVLASNLEFGEGDPRAVIEQVRRLGATTVVLTEVTPRAVAGLRAAGLDAELPHRIGSPGETAEGTMIWSAHRLTQVESGVARGSFHQPVVRVHRADGSYLLRGVHTYPPGRGLSQAWRKHLADLEAWAKNQPEDEPIVMAGDFNASQAHPGLRSLTSDFTDAQRAAGQGWVRTWPKEHTMVPFVALDHVLVRHGQVVDAGQFDVPQSDHAAVWARIRIG